MSVQSMSEMGKARKSKKTHGRFCLSWEDLCRVGIVFLFFCYFGLGFLFFGWLLSLSFLGRVVFGLGVFVLFL